MSFNEGDPASKHIQFNNYTLYQQTLEKGTSRQRSEKGAIRKKIPLQKPRWEKT